jgi:hypothetical protein
MEDPSTPPRAVRKEVTVSILDTDQVRRRAILVAVVATAILLAIPLLLLGGFLGEDDAEAGVLAAGSAACADVAAWHEETEARTMALAESFVVLEGDDPDPEAVRKLADQIEDLTAAQADADVPAAVEAANAAFVTLFDAFATALDGYADSLEADETAAAEADFIGALEPLGDELDAHLADLAAACGIELTA